MALTVEVTPDAAAVRAAADGWLREHRVEATVVAQVLHRVAASPRPDGPRFAVARDGAAVVGLALVAAGHPVALGPMPVDAATALASRLLDHDPPPDGVSGPVAACTAFADVVAARTRRGVRVVLREGVLVLGDLVRPRGVAGAARVAGPQDVDLVHAWMEAFVAEAVPGEPVPSRDGVAARVAAGAWLLWDDDGRPVCAAHLHAPVVGVGRIGPVRTPPEHRRNGYAAALTAAACCRLLAGGADDVVLLTDLANPTSNRVYERVGFRRTGEAVLLRFVEDQLP